MQFKLTTVGNFYDNEEERERLKKYGFNFQPSEYREYTIEGKPIIEIATLEELIDFAKECQYPIIFHPEIMEIAIYDDYAE